MYCAQCGNQVDDGTNFCPVCGRETLPMSGGRIDPQLPSLGITKTKSPRPSRKRLGVLVAGIGVLAAAVVAVVLVTTSSLPTLVPTGSGSGNVTWSAAGGPGDYHAYNIPVHVGGTVQGLSISATAIPEHDGLNHGSITGTVGGKSFTASLTGYEYDRSGESVVGTYDGMPLSGTAYTGSNYADAPVTIKGTIEGQPVRGTLTTRNNPDGSPSFTFSGTIGNLKVSGTAATLANGFTSTQQVG
jgi:hypothetical protein